MSYSCSRRASSAWREASRIRRKRIACHELRAIERMIEERKDEPTYDITSLIDSYDPNDPDWDWPDDDDPWWETVRRPPET